MNSTIEAPATTADTEEQLVAHKSDMTLFMSRRRSLRLVKVGRYPIMGQGGRKVGEEVGETVAFRDGRFDCPLTGEVMLEDGRKADAAEIHEWLERHNRNGDVNEGFWRVDPTAPSVSAEELDALLKAATELDAERLAAIVKQEEEGWGRDALLAPARGALERVEALHRQAREAAAQQATMQPPEMQAPPTPPAEG